ncbi:hypothetical protein L207DRAFT_538709 [Hyaloscypha variabilis F]|uniref:DUF6594 domain-containing protein n=1 Tax=Hyaloscypha variabilis (strain UAMH 11265 / GT02V1 / F) TaxID=1149755 RepID=A0A2J6QTC9_HYAVF|nr:hypothetical protein L207DRAFT_538709 [Hyaloscypha variabilis F]
MEGYARIATLMGRSPELGIFRGFKMLNAQNLLYLQAELTQLEIDLGKLRENDRAADRSLAYFTVLCNQEPPANSDLKFFNTWLMDKDMGNLPLRGLDRTIWGDAKLTPDLITIKRGRESDMLSQFFILRKPAEDLAENGALSEYSDAHVLAVLEVINTIIACLLPLSSIIILYCVSSLLVRLGIVIAYVVVFSACLALFTRARRVEIFAGVAGFAAVQVMFISATIVSVEL